MRSFLIALAVAAILPASASASASAFGELPFQTLSGGSTCLRATGMPGEISAWTPLGARFLRATPSGLTRTTTANLGAPRGCPVAAARPNGAGVVAVAVEGAVSVATREPGGDWGTPAKLAVPDNTHVDDLATAVSDRGDAVAIWTEESFERRGVITRARVARRPAGGAFGASQTLSTSDLPPLTATVQAGIAADGTAIAAWTHVVGSARRLHGVLDVAIAAPGAPFGAGQRLSSDFYGALGLAVAPDGHALVGFSGAGVRIAERAPGGGFGPVQKIGAEPATDLVVRLGSGAEALVAWRDDTTNDITYARRADASGFGPPFELVPGVADEDSSGEFTSGGEAIDVGDEGGGSGRFRPQDSTGEDLRAAFAPGGRVVFSWGHGRARSGITVQAAHVATLSADDRVATQLVGGPLRDAESIAPVVLENGTPAVVWGDNGRSDGRAHLALEGAAALPRQALEVHIGKPERTVLKRTQPLVLPVTCSAACDIRAQLRGASASASLPRAGTVRLQFVSSRGVAPLRAARVPVTVLSGPAGASEATTQVVRPRLRRIPDPPMPRILGLTAARSGSTVDVTWRVDRSARDVGFSAYSTRTRDGNPGSGGAFVQGSSKTTYHARLHEVPAKERYVTVEASRPGHDRHASVRIR